MAAPPSDGAAPAPPKSALRARIIFGLALIPLALAAVYGGGVYWAALVALAGAIMTWEWNRIVRGGFRWPGWVALVGVVIAIATEPYAGADVGLAIVGATAFAAALSGWADSGLRYGKWCALGALYVGLPCLAVLWLLEDPEAGFVTLLWLMAVTWATDTGGYVAGRLIGGPKLAPRISPNKTWAGLAGGIVGALAVGLVAGLWFGQGNVGVVLLISGTLAIVGQGGDLFESWVKRHFGVKDASNLIPGHGGVLDRVDGLVAVSLAVAIFELWIGHSPLLP